MKMQRIVVALVTAGAPLKVFAETAPVGKVLSMVSDLQATIIKEGEKAQKEYAEFAEWCEDRSRNLGFEIKTGKGEVESLKAAIAEEDANLLSLNTRVEELGDALASNSDDLKAASAVRSKEVADFTAEEQELMETIDMLGRASGILEREMSKGSSSLLQSTNAGNLASAFDALVRASMIGTSEAAKLTSLVQDAQRAREQDEDQAPGAPAAAVYESQSGNILQTMQDLREKAESQLAETRNKETAARHNFELLKQSLEDKNKNAAEDMEGAKKSIAESSEKKATAEGDLRVTSKELAADIKVKGSLHMDCMSKASAFEAETKSRGEELKALADAKAIIEKATGGAFGQVSLVQVGRTALASGKDLHRYEAVRIIRDLAHKHHSAALVQLASQMTGAMSSGDAFEKIKGLISDMIAKLEKEAGADATKKAYCDKELAESNEKKSDKTGEISKLTNRIDRMAAKSAQLKEQVAALQNELSNLAKSQARMDKIRQEEKANYEESKAELDKGLTGVKQALKILSEYYAQEGKAHVASEGAAGGIIGLLEVVEADFSKNLALITADEEAAVAEYEEETKANEIEKTAKDQDVKYKIKESKGLDKSAAELASDRSGVQAELDAVVEYLSRIEAECIAKAETYEARKAHRESELAGLKEALQILESETALMQREVVRRRFRGRSMLESSS